MSNITSKGDDPMNKVELLKRLLNDSRGNMFSLEIPTTKEDEKRFKNWLKFKKQNKKLN